MMEATVLGKRKRAPPKHPYLSGNFAPIQQTCPLTPCSYTGIIPKELLGGQYVRNGSNPVSNEDLGRDAHWFDGDGMLSGLLFKRRSLEDDTVEPQFVNQYILTDILLSTLSTPSLRHPILPSIATLVNPLSSLLRICLAIFRAIILVILSRFPGSNKTIKKISVANTAIIYHDGRALATCESGPPMRIQLPELDTIGWFDGDKVEGEPENGEKPGKTLGGGGLLHFMKEWTTAHPKVDPQTKEMVMFHSMFLPPYVQYSVIPSTYDVPKPATKQKKLLSAAVSGVSGAKMMHDFGVSQKHTVIMDLPLTLDPLQLAKNKPPIAYDATEPSRFGVFPRHEPSNVRWFETSACCIFHTVNTWDVFDDEGKLGSVDMLACRMTSATLVFSAGNIAAPQPTQATVKKIVSKTDRQPSLGRSSIAFEKGPSLESPTTERTALLRTPSHDPDASLPLPDEEEQCRLYYYSFSFQPETPTTPNRITHQYALSAIPFEFPSVHPSLETRSARYIYGCTTTSGNFNSALGRAAKIDALAKLDAHTLVCRAKAAPPPAVTGCVDTRSVATILASAAQNPGHVDAIQIFQTPPGMYAQEPRFVPAAGDGPEDAGFLLTYMFDEAQLGVDGEPPNWAVSELWVVDARAMRDVLAKVVLPQRVPYGLHGNWFPEGQVLGQRMVEGVRRVEDAERARGWRARTGTRVVGAVVRTMGG